jgi:16S rRNA (cytosine1402-N4)-methyltransferase
MGDEREIVRVLKDYGEERFAKRIARAICETRATATIETTAHLAALCERAVPFREPGKHPATRTFQALRIKSTANSMSCGRCWVGLRSAGRRRSAGGDQLPLAGGSHRQTLHSRRVPRRGAAEGAAGADDQLQRRLRPIGGAVRASEAEVRANPRSRSAVLRAAERLA